MQGLTHIALRTANVLRHFLLLLVLSGLTGQVSAREDTVDPAIAYAARVLGDAKRTRLIVDFDRPVEHDVYLMENPRRLVVDVDRTVFSLPDDTLPAKKSLVSSMRYGLSAPDQSRLELELSGPVSVETVSLSGQGDVAKQRLIIDLLQSNEAAFIEAVRKPKPVAPVVEGPQKQFKIMLDPGHGGADGGARGAGGVAEKIITLAFAEKLRAIIKQHPRVDVFMTRDSDEFVSLRRRLEAIRASEADLMISIHADSLRQKRIRGATVYTLSEDGSDTLSRLLARKQNRSDLIAGLHLPDMRDDATDILIDLTRRETEQFSVAFADNLVVTLKNVTRMINNPHRSANFHVLKAPEIPSVLLELGYLSNPKDEAQLADGTWQASAANAVAEEVLRFLMPAAMATRESGK